MRQSFKPGNEGRGGYVQRRANIKSRIWMAEKIGWRALAESWRKTLAEFEAKHGR